MAPVVIWLIAAIAFILVDILTSSFLFVWFSIGAFASLVASLLGLSMSWQLVIFSVLSLISVSIGYPWARKKYKKMIKKTPLMEETYIGKVIVAKEDIFDLARIKVGGIYWTGVNRGDIIKKGQKFTVVGLEGNKFIIEGLKEA